MARHARALVPVLLTAGVTGSYVYHKDSQRVSKMIHQYQTGYIVPPLDDINHQISYFSRPKLEDKINRILSSNFSNQYYVMKGEYGVGKSRMILKAVKDLQCSHAGQGAPIYVSIDQGKSFAQTLARAIGFEFDEHINFGFFLDVLFRVASFPSKEDDHQLSRTLDAFEQSASVYCSKYKQPVVIIIDNADHLPHSTLLRMQRKAKFWADTNIAKVVFVINSKATEVEMQKNASSWSRLAAPLVIGELGRAETINFLMESNLSASSFIKEKATISWEEAQLIYHFAGGCFVDLLTFKYALAQGYSVNETAEKLILKEREKFVLVAVDQHQWNVVCTLAKTKNCTMKWIKLVKDTSDHDVNVLLENHILRLERQDAGKGLVVKFASKITECAAKEIMAEYK